MKLCACNECGHIYEDTNPQVDAKEYPDEIPVRSLQKFYVVITELDTGYWGCPKCCTDAALTDDIENHVEQNRAVLLTGLILHQQQDDQSHNLALLLTQKGDI